MGTAKKRLHSTTIENRRKLSLRRGVPEEELPNVSQ